jgi:predicted Na+-dependent transporter
MEHGGGGGGGGNAFGSLDLDPMDENINGYKQNLNQLRRHVLWIIVYISFGRKKYIGNICILYHNILIHILFIYTTTVHIFLYIY